MKSGSKKYDACIFDLDGTLTDTLEDLKNSVNFAMRSMGFPERTLDEVRRFVGNGMEKLIKRSIPENADDEAAAKALGFFKEYYRDHLNDTTVPYDGIMQMLIKLRDRGIKTAVVSNKADEAVKAIVSGFFGGLIIVSRGKMPDVPPKPSPEAVFEVMKTLGCENAVYAGDSDVDVETAHNAGLECIGVTWGFRGRELLEKCSADYIVDSPDEILSIVGC